LRSGESAVSPPRAARRRTISLAPPRLCHQGRASIFGTHPRLLHADLLARNEGGGFDPRIEPEQGIDRRRKPAGDPPERVAAPNHVVPLCRRHRSGQALRRARPRGHLRSRRSRSRGVRAERRADDEGDRGDCEQEDDRREVPRDPARRPVRQRLPAQTEPGCSSLYQPDTLHTSWLSRAASAAAAVRQSSDASRNA